MGVWVCAEQEIDIRKITCGDCASLSILVCSYVFSSSCRFTLSNPELLGQPPKHIASRATVGQPRGMEVPPP